MWSGILKYHALLLPDRHQVSLSNTDRREETERKRRWEPARTTGQAGPKQCSDEEQGAERWPLYR